MSEIKIRPAETGDLDILLQFEQGVIETERPFDPTLKKDPIHYYELEEMIKSSQVHLVVAEVQGELIASGYVRIETDKPYLVHSRRGYLGFMYTVPSWRGKGVNQLIIEELKNWSKEQDLKELRLDVYSENEKAIKAYEKAGFKRHMLHMRMGLCLLFLFFLQFDGITQNKTTRGWFYTSFGWHRAFYSNSTIHFQNDFNPNFNFKLIKAKAIDDNDIAVGKGIEAPQWSMRLGYLFNNKKQTGIELSYDHAKYVLKQGQTVRLVGTINGSYFDKDTLIHPDFIEYEHTDGANYYMLSFIKRIALQKKTNQKFDLLCKAGAGLVIPRTDSRIMGFSYNERYHISGYVAGLEGNFRYQFLKNIFAEFSAKGVFARYGDVLLYGEGRAEQQWLSGQLLFTLAYQIPNKSY